MSQIDDGGPAFPVAGGCVSSPGMSLRDWFAGQERIDPNDEFGVGLCEALAPPPDPDPVAWTVLTALVNTAHRDVEDRTVRVQWSLTSDHSLHA